MQRGTFKANDWNAGITDQLIHQLLTVIIFPVDQ